MEGNRGLVGSRSTVREAFKRLLLPYQVDLCWLAAVDNPSLCAHIGRVGPVLYEQAAAPGANGEMK
ncbi:hypothetical protein [Sulfuricystis multivorans]|uniref:hypothetical protein n=1 Tax=Sulfuricystis multivorans TaxID=2211108 RepID=UPI0024DF8015|nr:hypothetical protein [Sulfuricystis multivorans]